ncbi:hypothetical protein [Anaerospora hongkongensis]|uniref:hypothetical protein n=1 Tax=Anaerospora hongkongensis TaxID=244830 RepID=UPI002FDA7451
MGTLTYEITLSEARQMFTAICREFNAIKLDISDFDKIKQKYRKEVAMVNLPPSLINISQFGAIQFGGAATRHALGEIAYIELRFYRTALNSVGLHETIDKYIQYRDDSNEAIRFRFHKPTDDFVSLSRTIATDITTILMEKFKDSYTFLPNQTLPESLSELPRHTEV